MKLSGTARKNGVYLIFKRENTHIARIVYSAYFTFHQYNLGNRDNIKHGQNPNFMILDHLQIDVNTLLPFSYRVLKMSHSLLSYSQNGLKALPSK